jgi:hypothetical protein
MGSWLVPRKRSLRVALRTRSASPGASSSASRKWRSMSERTVRGRRDDHPAGSRIELDAFHVDSAPVGVVGAGQRGPHVVGRGPDAARHERVHAVGADHDLRLLAHRRAADRSAADAHHPLALGHERLDRELLAHLGTGLGGCLDENVIEDGAANGIGVSDVTRRRRCALEREGPDIERVAADRRAVGPRDLRQQSPALEAGHARLMDVVGRQPVARKARPVHQQSARTSSRSTSGW